MKIIGYVVGGSSNTPQASDVSAKAAAQIGQREAQEPRR